MIMMILIAITSTPTSMVRESTKWPPWHKFKLSSPMNQSGDGTIFVKRDTWKCDCNCVAKLLDKSARHLTSPKSVQYVAWRRFFKTGKPLRTTSMSLTLLMLVCRFFRNTASGGFCTHSTYFTRSTYYTYSTRLHILCWGAAHCSVVPVLELAPCSGQSGLKVLALGWGGATLNPPTKPSTIELRYTSGWDQWVQRQIHLGIMRKMSKNNIFHFQFRKLSLYSFSLSPVNWHQSQVTLAPN